jgi:phosphoglycolate phosphatase-like HAD superfamily hydrolase
VAGEKLVMHMREPHRMMNEFQFGKGADGEIPAGYSIFCDMDGTLVDTDYANYLSYRRAVVEVTCGTHDIEFTNERLNRESLQARLPLLTATQQEAIISLKSKYFTECLSHTRVNIALEHLIMKHCGRNGIFLVTYCREKRAAEVLEYHKLIACFTRLICWEALPEGATSNKYESAIFLTGVSPETVFVFENDSTCVEQAALAGVPRSNLYTVNLEWGVML